jgi:transcriptional regulator with XRE-family HTH domain
MDERERLIEIMNSQGVTAKQFSLELGISAGTLSNIIGGRNKPSLELLKSIAAHYPSIQSDWLFLGKGEMYTSDYEPPVSQISTGEPDLFSQINSPSIVAPTQPLSQSETSLVSATTSMKDDVKTAPSVRTIQKLIIFYSDGTYEER